MFGITVTQVGSAVRSAVMFAAGYAVSKGYIDNEMAITIAGAASAVSVAVYSMYLRSKNKLVDAAIKVTEIK